MKEFRGTKGKWDAQLVSTGNGSFYRVGIFGGESVCNITTRNSDRALANTCLIAAAPELLEALQGILNIVKDSSGVAGYHINGNVADWSEFSEIEKATQVVNKALGEEKI